MEKTKLAEETRYLDIDKIENIELDAVYSYQQLCEALGTTTHGGDSKVSQLAEWKRYFNWEYPINKKTHKPSKKMHIIEIYDEPKIKERGRELNKAPYKIPLAKLFASVLQSGDYRYKELCENIKIFSYTYVNYYSPKYAHYDDEQKDYIFQLSRKLKNAINNTLDYMNRNYQFSLSLEKSHMLYDDPNSEEFVAPSPVDNETESIIKDIESTVKEKYDLHSNETIAMWHRECEREVAKYTDKAHYCTLFEISNKPTGEDITEEREAVLQYFEEAMSRYIESHYHRAFQSKDKHSNKYTGESVKALHDEIFKSHK